MKGRFIITNKIDCIWLKPNNIIVVFDTVSIVLGIYPKNVTEIGTSPGGGRSAKNKKVQNSKGGLFEMGGGVRIFSVFPIVNVDFKQTKKV